jgi:hypothetical protein
MKHLDLNDLQSRSMDELRILFADIPEEFDSIGMLSNQLGLRSGSELAELLNLLHNRVKKISLATNELHRIDLSLLMNAFRPGWIINLSQNNIGRKKGTDLSAMFAAVRPGVTLDLSYNGLGGKTGEELAAMMAAIQPGVSIDLNCNGLGNLSDEKLAAMFAAIKPGVKIHVTDWIGHSEKLAMILAAIRPGVNIDLGNNGWGVKDQELAAALAVIQPGVTIGLEVVTLRYTTKKDLAMLMAAFQPGVIVNLAGNLLINFGSGLADIVAAIQPGVILDLRRNRLDLNTNAALAAIFAAFQPGVAVDVSENGLGEKTSEELAPILAAIQPGVIMNLGLHELSHVAGITQALGSIREGVTLALAPNDLENFTRTYELLSSARNLTSIALNDAQFNTLDFTQLTNHLMLLPPSIQTLQISTSILANFSPARRERLNALLKTRFTQVIYHAPEQVESVLPLVTESLDARLPDPVQDIVIGYLASENQKDRNWESAIKEDRRCSKLTLPSLLSQWIEDHRSERRNRNLIKPLIEFLDYAQRALKQEENPGMVQGGIFLTLELLDGNMSLEEYQQFAQGLKNPEHPALAQKMLTIAVVFGSLALAAAITLPVGAAIGIGATCAVLSGGFFAANRHYQPSRLSVLTDEIEAVSANIPAVV